MWLRIENERAAVGTLVRDVSENVSFRIHVDATFRYKQIVYSSLRFIIIGWQPQYTGGLQQPWVNILRL